MLDVNKIPDDVFAFCWFGCYPFYT